MNVLHAPDVTDKFTTQFIRRTAKAIVRDGIFPRSDLDDVIQELHLALFRQADNFDPERARWSTFVKTVVRLTAKTLRRKQRADFRQLEAACGSLNVLIPDENGQLVDLGATVGEEEHRTGLGQGHVSHTLRIELAIDVERIVSRLPTALREVCEGLQRLSLRELSVELGVPRTTILRRLEEIRERFQEAGLDDAA